MPPPAFTRSHALMSMTSKLGGDVLVPTRFEMVEAINAPFLATVEAVSTRADIDPDALLVQPVCITLRGRSDVPRHVHGLVRRSEARGPVGRQLYGYRLEVVPRLWFLSQTEDCRIFENKSAQDILRTLFADARLTDVSFRVSAPPVRPFTVQYNETDLAFATRLIEEEGWFAFHQHSQGAHTLVIADAAAAFEDVPDNTLARRAGEGPDCLSGWRAGRATAHGSTALADYDPEHPAAGLHGQTATTFKAPDAASRDRFRWPALALNNDAIAARTRRLEEAAELAASEAEGAGFNPHLRPGARITVADARDASQTGYIVTRVAHEASDATWTNDGTPPRYANSFAAVPSALPWRPLPSVKRPRMEGIHTAEVIGPAGEEIHTDALGRVKLRFRWDHRDDATPGGAIWVRVMQGWAGPKTGFVAIPRVGTEVLVAFMDGDPDRPVVIGQVHNGAQTPPLSLPEQKTRTGLRTRSSPGGGEQDFSELWFDDKAGQELVFLHAQKDLTTEVEHDATTTIDNNRAVTIKAGNDKLEVQQGNRSVDVPLGNHTITSRTGDISVTTQAGAISLEAGTSITLKVGPSSITLTPSGVEIKGLTVKVEGQMLTSLKGTITQIDADALLKATGGVMMLN
jgi:type VI secretion system secreted protein VgrG